MNSPPSPDAQDASTRPLRIDAHHHLWHYVARDYDWIDDSMSVLRRDFLVPDLEKELRLAQVDGTVVVQARQTTEETDWLLSIAQESNRILGVVGWLPLSSPAIGSHLERLSCNRLLKGLRHVVQGEPTGFLDTGAFNTGIALLRGTGLIFDLLILSHQLEEATRFVDRFPYQMFVLDHMAKPKIAANAMEPWRTQIKELSLRENVACKVSGLVTEADPLGWTSEQLHRYVEAVLESFGPDRIMVGSDWPVLSARCDYARWWKLIEQWITPLSVDERSKITQGTARRIYNLGDRPSSPDAI